MILPLIFIGKHLCFLFETETKMILIKIIHYIGNVCFLTISNRCLDKLTYWTESIPLKNLIVHSIVIIHEIYSVNFGFVTNSNSNSGFA